MTLRDEIVRLAYENPDLRKNLLPLLKASSDNPYGRNTRPPTSTEMQKVWRSVDVALERLRTWMDRNQIDKVQTNHHFKRDLDKIQSTLDEMNSRLQGLLDADQERWESGNWTS